MPAGQVFVLNQKLTSLSGDLWIQDAQGNRAFEVDGKALSVRDTHVLLDPSGNPLYTISQSLAHLHKTYEIKQGDRLVATIQQAIVSFMRDRFKIILADGGELTVKGDYINREFKITQGGRDVVVATRKLVSLRDSYSVQIAPDFDTQLALAIVIGLERLELKGRSDGPDIENG